MIKKISVRNFKSFKDLEIELGKFNVLIGANASGKSNFVSIFQFLRDIAEEGLDNAVSLQGGIEYLRNLNVGTDQNLSIQVVSEDIPGVLLLFPTLSALLDSLQAVLEGKNERDLVDTMENIMGTKCETTYEFELEFNKKGSGFEIVKDDFNQKYKFVGREGLKKGKGEEVELHIYREKNGKINIETKPENVLNDKRYQILKDYFTKRKISPHRLLLSELFSPDIFLSLSIYNFDPKLSKKAIPISGKAELEENGENLAIVLKHILKDREKRRKFFNLVKDILPFVDELKVEKYGDRSLLFNVKEKYFQEQYLPASLISDGTVNIVALTIALYFERKPLIIIEEPERNIHPYLISRVVDMMKDASQNKQIIVTTHNPEFVKYAGIENLLLVYRDERGFSRISKPEENKEVETFLKNNIGLDELYVQNLLGGE